MKKVVGRPTWWRPDLAVRELEADLEAGYQGDDLFPHAQPTAFEHIERAEIFARLHEPSECQATLWDAETGFPVRYFYDLEEFARHWLGDPQAAPLKNPERITLFLEAGPESARWLREFQSRRKNESGTQ